MTSHTDLDEARNEALRKIGRNVVNFQKIEAMLKHLLAQGNINGCASELKKLQAHSVASLAKQPMGKLADAFGNSAYSRKATSDDAPEDLAEAFFSFSFKIESDKDFAKERKKTLKVLVEERNKLIHQMLAHFNPNSLESCNNICAELDDQNAKVVPEFKYFKSVVDTLNVAQKELIDFLDSGDWGKITEDQGNGP